MKKVFEANSIIEAIDNASKELDIPFNDVHYIIKNDKSDEKVVIEVYSLEDVCNFGKEYLKNIIDSLGIDTVIRSNIDEDNVIHITIESEEKSILIGKNGVTLKAFDELINLAVSSKFKKKMNIFFDIGDYRSRNHIKIVNITKQAAIEAIEKHNEIKLNITNDYDKKAIFQVLKKFNDVTGEIVGFGDKKAVLIKYKNHVNIADHNKQDFKKENNVNVENFFTSANSLEEQNKNKFNKVNSIPSSSVDFFKKFKNQKDKSMSDHNDQEKKEQITEDND